MKPQRVSFSDPLPAHRERFARLCREALLSAHEQGDAGIGTMKEKRLHSLLKHYLCEDERFHEVGVAGTRYVSDVRIGNDVCEVQTGAFYPMKKKIEHYLTNTDCTVTIVHPVASVRWISVIDPVSREISPKKRAPATERAEDLLSELSCLLPFAGNPRLRVLLLSIEVQDFRLLEGRGRRRRAEKFERVPVALLGELTFGTPEDYRIFLPDGLPEVFTVRQFSERTGIRGADAYFSVRTLTALGLIAPAEAVGRAQGYRVCPKE